MCKHGIEISKKYRAGTLAVAFFDLEIRDLSFVITQEYV
jgi:hypothetical protein